MLFSLRSRVVFTGSNGIGREVAAPRSIIPTVMGSAAGS